MLECVKKKFFIFYKESSLFFYFSTLFSNLFSCLYLYFFVDELENLFDIDVNFVCYIKIIKKINTAN